MTKNMSVLEKAQRLQREAHRLDLGRAGAQEAERVQARVHTLRGAVGELRMLAKTARFLQERTGISIDLSTLGHGYKELIKNANGNIPSNQAFVHAERRIKSTSEALATAIQVQWQKWANGRLSALRTTRIAMLNRTQQARSKAMVKSLRALASTASPNLSQITEFINQYESLADELQQAQDAPPELLDLLDRLSGGGVILADITDAEIALLRAHAMDQQIELKRKAL